MRRFSAAFIAALFVVGVMRAGSVRRVRVRRSGRPAGRVHRRAVRRARPAAIAPRPAPRPAIARQYTPGRHRALLPQRDLAGRQASAPGASLVVYMGHGNGWPSHYRDALYPVSQNGFGLNPTAGGGDSAHQYFGEAAVGSQIQLAKNAVVLLNHLCYASGQSEPGLPEGTLDSAASASTTTPPASSGPAPPRSSRRRGPARRTSSARSWAASRSIQAAWQSSPNANGNGSPSRAAAAPAISPRWTRRPRRPASADRS